MASDKMSVTELAKALETHLTEKGYCSAYRNSVVLVQRAIVKYCMDQGEDFYRDELGQQFLKDRLSRKKRLGQDRLSVLKRSIQMMSDYQQFGTIIIRRRSERVFPEQFTAHCNAYIENLRRAGRAENTIKSKMHSLYNQTEFLDGIRSNAI